MRTSYRMRLRGFKKVYPENTSNGHEGDISRAEMKGWNDAIDCILAFMEKENEKHKEGALMKGELLILANDYAEKNAKHFLFNRKNRELAIQRIMVMFILDYFESYVSEIY